MKQIRVIGIDPAPSKKSTVYDGKNFKQMCFNELQTFLNKKEVGETKRLICWDAPLSFSLFGKSPFYKRPIETFFTSKKGLKTPKGISVQGYGGCPHWAISQHLLGYPKISNHSESFTPPYKLIFDNEFNLDEKNGFITEVHPAVAIWLWCQDIKQDENWKYNKDKTVFNEIINILKEKNVITDIKGIESDDNLDAYISWKLGTEWANKKGKVEILGNSDTGSFLIPKSEKNVKNKLEVYLKNDLKIRIE